jgi:hypothetical protein
VDRIAPDMPREWHLEGEKNSPAQPAEWRL